MQFYEIYAGGTQSGEIVTDAANKASLAQCALQGAWKA
jgi:hypothetical protein